MSVKSEEPFLIREATSKDGTAARYLGGNCGRANRIEVMGDDRFSVKPIYENSNLKIIELPPPISAKAVVLTCRQVYPPAWTVVAIS